MKAPPLSDLPPELTAEDWARSGKEIALPAPTEAALWLGGYLEVHGDFPAFEEVARRLRFTRTQRRTCVRFANLQTHGVGLDVGFVEEFSRGAPSVLLDAQTRRAARVH